MRFVCFFIALTCALPVSAQVNDPLLTILENELVREVNEFKSAKTPPYYIGYRVNDLQTASVASSFGSLVSSYEDHGRVLYTEVKVGDYKFDNTHEPETDDGQFAIPRFDGAGAERIPLNNDADAISFAMWRLTEQQYKAALEGYELVNELKTDAPAKNVDDFSKETPSVFIENLPVPLNEYFNRKAWEERIKLYTKGFLSNESIVEGDASLDVSVERKYFVSSEGTRVVQNRSFAYLNIQGSILASDGDIVPLHLSYFAFHPDELPSSEVILKDVNEMIGKLAKLKDAPLVDAYSGPAILNSRAAAVFFHEIFGHRVEGHRLKDKNDGQTFKDKINELVLPKSLSVVFDPTMARYNGQALNGYYQFDDEGVKGQRVKVVDKGVLKTFLMSRTPIDNLANSNGHGRANAGASAVTRQSNLIIENTKATSMQDLRKLLIAECKKQKKRYGYLFMDVIGGYTTTDRYQPNAFNIFPTEVYRVYVDGTPDELVRGVDLIGTPLSMFAEIAAADGSSEIFTGFCGAESGSIPVTAVSPSIFVKRIETQKKAVVHVEKPLLAKPVQHNTTQVTD